MAITRRKDILDDMLYRLGLIKTANGYSVTIVTVARQRDTEVEPFLPEECPALNLRDGKAQTLHNISDDEHQLPVSVDIHTTSDVTADDATEILGDVVKCVNLNDTWNGHADGTAIEGHGVDISQTADTIQAGELDITVNYTTDKGKI